MAGFSVLFNDPGSAYAAYYSRLSAAITAAGATWTQLLGINATVSIEISVQFDPNLSAYATGGSAANVSLGIRNGYNILRSGTMDKLLTGADANGTAPDGRITIGPNFLADPAFGSKAEFVIEHEIGHILGFNGLADGKTGALPSMYATTFDRYVVLGNDGNEYFTGPNAEAAYNGPVPLTYGNYGHVGNPPPRPGSELILDLMNPGGARTPPTVLDTAILQDTEAPISSDSVLTPYPNGLFRFFDKVHGTQFLTSSPTEKVDVLTTRRDLVYEGVDLSTVTTNDPNAAPIYRFFDTSFGTHFLTASRQERDAVLATRSDLKFEGVGFYEHATARPGDSAVYRFFDSSYGTHFYTSDAGERAGILATRPDLKPEGVGFYASAT